MTSAGDVAAGLGRPLYRCEICHAEYTRPDHLTRHAKTHSEVPSCVCSVCGRGFARQDVLRRHERTHGLDPANSPSKRNLPDEGDRSQGRVGQACLRCAAKKLKCSNEKPCVRCRDHDVECVYPPASSTPTSSIESHGQMMPGPSQTYPFPQQSLPIQHMAGQIPPQDPRAYLNPGMPPPVDGQMLPVMDGGVPFGNVPLGDGFINMLDSKHLPDFTQALGDFIGHDNSAGVDTPMLHNGVAELPGSLLQTYQNSVFRPWETDVSNKDADEPHGLHIDPVRHRVEPPFRPSRLRIELQAPARDRLLHMALQNRDSASRDRILSSFPSAELLSDLINASISASVQGAMTVGEVVHSSTLLDLNNAPAELIGALVCNGACFSQPPPIDHFGQAIQETVRISLQRKFDTDPASLRSLPMLQAFYLQQCVGYYTANSRKIETAEAISSLGGTCLRRLGRLRNSGEEPIRIPAGASPSEVQHSWLQWIERQSWSRLAFFAFVMDAHISNERDVQMTLNASEITTQLPLDRRYWDSTTAARWMSMADVHIREHEFPAGPTFQQVLSNPSRFTTYPSLDLYVAASAVNAAHWILVREFRQLNSFDPSDSMWQTFVLSSRQAELRSALQQFRQSCGPVAAVTPEVRVFAEAVAMHLNVHMEDMHHYAGKPAPAEAQAKARADVGAWSQTAEARMAVYHAGQILRLCRLLPPRGIVGTPAILLFQATLVVWTYAVSSLLNPSMEHESARSTVSEQQRFIRIDQEDDSPPSFASTITKQAPTLCVSDVEGATIPVTDPARSIRQYMQTMEQNWGSFDRNNTAAACAHFISKLHASVAHL